MYLAIRSMAIITPWKYNFYVYARYDIRYWCREPPPLTATKLIKAFDLYRFCKYKCISIMNLMQHEKQIGNINLVVYRDLKMVFCLDEGFICRVYWCQLYRYIPNIYIGIIHEIKTFGCRCFLLENWCQINH